MSAVIPPTRTPETEAAMVEAFGFDKPETTEVANAEEAAATPDGQWVQDSTGENYCLIETHMGFPQRMAMGKGGRSATALDNLSYPLHLADFIGGCEHRWGSWELGHCRRCGQVVFEPSPMFFDSHAQAAFEAAAIANTANGVSS